MGSLSTEANQLSSATKNESGTSIETSGTLSSPSTDGANVQALSKKLSSVSSSSSSSSSSGFPLDDPIGDDKHHEPASSSTLPEHDNDAQTHHENCEKPVSGSSPSKHEPTITEVPVSVPPTEVTSSNPTSCPNNMSTTESPPDQTMERPDTSKYRIPSHVFARSKSKSGMEWSVASNESLFSIHMGNMSFTKDQLFWRAEDLGLPVEPSTPGQMFNNSSNQSPGSIPGAADGKNQELGVAKATVKEVTKENQDQDQDQNHEKSITEGRISRYSDGSGTSGKSFQFPILADVDKNVSISIDGPARLGTNQQQTQSQTKSTEQTQPEPVQQPQSDAPAATQPQAGFNWFPCLSYFSCCR